MTQISLFTIAEQLNIILISYSMILAITRKTAIFTAIEGDLKQVLIISQ